MGKSESQKDKISLSSIHYYLPDIVFKILVIRIKSLSESFKHFWQTGSGDVDELYIVSVIFKT